MRDNNKGVWIETQYLPLNKCNKLKNGLGSWFLILKDSYFIEGLLNINPK
ncbi:hypothetical protein [uncultured Clostridium sp.]|nr:hypothetical protein [uncultured Clostridium sp.]